MMRRWLSAGILAGLVAACGGESDDFTIQVERSADAALTSLAQMDVTGAPLISGTKPITRTASNGGVVEYTIPAAEGYSDGVIRFTVSGSDNTPTTVAAMVDIPAVEGKVEGADKYVAESKVEKALKNDLKSWAVRMEDSNSFGKATGAIETSMMSLAVILQHMDNLDQVEKRLAGVGSSFFDSDESSSGNEPTREWGEGSDPNRAAFDPEPMNNPDDDASSYGRPMDETEGTDTDPDGW